VSLLAILQWCEHSDLFVLLRSSSWFFPVTAALHLFGLTLVGGTTVLVDLRLLGVDLWRDRAPQIVLGLERWLLIGLGIMVPTGLLMFLSTATKCYYLTAFWTKMTALALVLALTFTVRRRAAGIGDTHARRLPSQFIAVLSLTLWTIVAVCGRLIGFY
jgi:hypothetical protein